MKRLRYIAGSCCALVLWGCSSAEGPKEAGQVTVVFQADAGHGTRTELAGADAVQHVASAFLYIFGGTGADAPCLACEDIGWVHQDEHTSVSQRYTVRRNLAAGSYTLLAVGLDDRSGAAYGLPGSIAADTPLSEARARLAVGKTRQDIALSELFAGMATAVVAGGSTEVPITLRRRTAGMIGYFKHIPAEAAGLAVRSLKVILYKEQHADVPLAVQPADFGETALAGGETVMEFDLSGYAQAAGQTYLAIPARSDGTAATIENSILGGAYLLPLEAPASAKQATLAIQLFGDDLNDPEGADLLRTYTVRLEAGGISYPLAANNLYTMGRKPVAAETTNDEPLDLSTDGQVEIVVHPEWNGTIDVPLD